MASMTLFFVVRVCVLWYALQQATFKKTRTVLLVALGACHRLRLCVIKHVSGGVFILVVCIYDPL